MQYFYRPFKRCVTNCHTRNDKCHGIILFTSFDREFNMYLLVHCKFGAQWPMQWLRLYWRWLGHDFDYSSCSLHSLVLTPESTHLLKVGNECYLLKVHCKFFTRILMISFHFYPHFHTVFSPPNSFSIVCMHNDVMFSPKCWQQNNLSAIWQSWVFNI